MNDPAVTVQPSQAQPFQFLEYVLPPTRAVPDAAAPATADDADAASAELHSELNDLRQQLLGITLSDLARLLRLPDAAFWSTVLWPVRASDGHGDASTADAAATPHDSLLPFLDSYLAKRIDFVRSRAVAAATQPQLESLPPIDPCADLEARLDYAMFRVCVRLLTPPSISSAAPAHESHESSAAMLIQLHGGSADSSVQVWTDDAWLKSLTDRGIICCERILQVCRLYSDGNAAILRPLVSFVFENAPAIADELQDAVTTVLDAVHVIQRKRQKAVGLQRVDAAPSPDAKGKGKGSGKGKMAAGPTEDNVDNDDHRARDQVTGSAKGKGKGKGKAAADPEPDHGSAADAASPRVATASTDEIEQEASFLLDVMHDLASGVTAGGPAVALLLLNDPRMLKSLISVYDLAAMQYEATTSLPPLRHGSASGPVDVRAIFEDRDAETNSTARLCRQLKRSILALLDRLIHTLFIDPARESIQNLSELERLLGGLCDIALSLFELCAIDGPSVYLRNAPLFLDFEIEYSLGDELRDILRLQSASVPAEGSVPDAETDEGLDSTRIDYVILSLEQMLAFSGNADTRRVVARAKEELAAGPSQHGSTANRGTASAPPPGGAYSSAAHDEYIKRTLLISSVHDLFPDLGDGFIEACLVAMNDDQEAVIMKIIEDDLPDYIKRLDRSMPRTSPRPPPMPQSSSLDVIPHSLRESVVWAESGDATPVERDVDDLLANRRNVYDGDELDVFSRGNTVDRTKITQGKTERAHLIEQERTQFVQDVKSVILESQYDEYDDEYDDTYDSTDIRLAGTVELHMGDENETAVLDRKQRMADANNQDSSDPTLSFEAFLVSMYTSDPSVFQQSQRKSAKRAQMRQMTGMSDEQIEGWFKMLERNPRKGRVLEKYEWRGNHESALTPNPNRASGRERERTDSAETGSDSDQGGLFDRGDRGDRGRGGSRGGADRRGGFGDGRGGRGGGPARPGSPQTGNRTGGHAAGGQGGRGASAGSPGGDRGGRGGGRGGRGRGAHRDAHARKMGRGMMGVPQ
ncbi:hypothetical protein BC831DRAFT_452883 [Entophlyctis helioformis]|nr:hypothetical protein BC831DRAFT_452883 [Entophlyctis helioformis]